MAKLVGAAFTRYEARLALRNFFWNKLSYPLWVTNFSKTQCRTLQKLFMKHFLPRIGYNRKMPLAIIHGPTNNGGLGLLHVEYEQGLLHAVILLRHLRLPFTDLLHRQLYITLCDLQIESGITTPVLSFPAPMDELQHYLLPSWLKTTWVYLHSLEISLSYDHLPFLRPQRSNDMFIMECFACRGISAKDLRRLKSALPPSP